MINLSEIRHNRFEISLVSFSFIEEKTSGGAKIINNRPSSDHSLSKSSCGIAPTCCSPS